MRLLTTFLAVCLLPVTLSFADVDNTTSKGTIFPERQLKKPAIISGNPNISDYRGDTAGRDLVFKQAQTNLERPSKDTYVDSNEGHFRVHYDISGIDAPDSADIDENGIPDYIDSTLVFLETACSAAMALGYGAPKSDSSRGGSDAVDCYIEELSSENLYGQTIADGTGSSTSSYLVVDNNFTDTIYHTEGFNGLKITSAHEFFHVIQYGYYSGTEASWWSEHTAVWFENYVWDEVDDYLYYLGFIIDNRALPIDTYNGSFEYGAALFAFFIAEKYGEDMLQTIWRKIRDIQSGTIGVVGSELPGGLNQALSDFSVWLYFTGYRANTMDFFEESDLIRYMVDPDYSYYGSISVSDTLSLTQHTFRYVEITPPNGFAIGDTLRCDYSNPEGGSWMRQVILYNSPYDYSIHPLDRNNRFVPIFDNWDSAIISITDVTNNWNHHRFIFNIEITVPIFVAGETTPENFILNRNYPNPFNPSTTISFVSPETAPVVLQIVNLQGQTVDTLVDSYVSPGVNSVTFDGSGYPSGVYFIRLTAGETILTRKITLLK